MKNAYTNSDIVSVVRLLDVRAKNLTTDQIDLIIDDAYAELCTVVQAFSDEEIVNLQEYYDNNQFQLTLNIEEDVVDIYDLYLTIENQDKAVYDQGIEKIRDKQVIYVDSRYNGRVHIDLEGSNKKFNNAVIKYYYTPTSTTDTVYMDSQLWIAFKSALGASLYDAVHDTDRNTQKRAEMVRRAKAIIPSMPEDGKDPSIGHIFYEMDY